MNYLMPFLIILCVGVILVLLFNLWKAIFSSDDSGSAFLHLESGSVQVKMWNTEEFFNLTSDALIMQGDEIQTSADAKVIIEFFDGTLMRLSGNTNVILNVIDKEEGDEEISVLLVNGKIWLNKLLKSVGDTKLVVDMGDVIVNSLSGSIFEVESEFDDIVRVLNGGDVLVDIKNRDGTKVVETENVGVGQEIVFTDKVIEKYWEFLSPSVLSALSDEFKDTDWYLWNVSQDVDPVKFSKSAILGEGGDFVEVESQVSEPEVVEPEEVEEAEDVESEEVETLVELGPLTVPSISSVSGGTQTNENGFYVVTGSLATLSGSVSGADKVVVNGYTLQKFISGDSSWTYYANADYGLMQKGENIYEIYAIAPDGTKSETLTVKVLYNPPQVEVEVSDDEAGDEEVLDEEVPTE
jgi:hypothetical protein